MLWVIVYFRCVFVCATVESHLVSVYLFFCEGFTLFKKMWNYMHAAPWLIYDREFDRITHHKKTKQRAPTWRTSWTGEEIMAGDKTRSQKPERQLRKLFWGRHTGRLAESV